MALACDWFSLHDAMLRRKIPLRDSSVLMVQEKITIATTEVHIEECSAAMEAMKLFQTFTTSAVAVSTLIVSADMSLPA